MKTPISTLRALATSLVICAGLAGIARADFTPVALPTLTTDIRTWSDGGAYAGLFPTSSPTLGGVDFEFQADGNGNTAFYLGNLEISVGVYGVTSAYSLINSAYGAFGATVGAITFTGSAGAFYSVNLVEGFNVRDHYYGGFENGLSDPLATAAVWGSPLPGHAHLDMQKYLLPTAFSTQTLTKINFYSYNGGGDGIPFLAAVTVETPSAVPDTGSTLVLMALGLSGLVAFRRRAA